VVFLLGRHICSSSFLSSGAIIIGLGEVPSWA
jgi:hypothetical protein